MPAPPHSEGMATPRRPISPSFFTTSAGKWCCSSHCRAWGFSSLSAKSRQRSFTWRCSSVSSKFMCAPVEESLLEVGLPLLEERRHALPLILTAEERREERGLEPEPVLPRHVEAARDRLLRRGEGVAGMRRE